MWSFPPARGKGRNDGWTKSLRAMLYYNNFLLEMGIYGRLAGELNPQRKILRIAVGFHALYARRLEVTRRFEKTDIFPSFVRTDCII